MIPAVKPPRDENSLDPVEKVAATRTGGGVSRTRPPPGYMTRAQAARILGISTETVRRKEGVELEFTRSGTAVYISEASVRKFGSNGANAPDGETTAAVFKLLRDKVPLADIAIQLALPGRMVAAVFDEWLELAQRDARMLPKPEPSVCRQCEDADATLCPACVSAAMATVTPPPAEAPPCVTGCGETASIHVCPTCMRGVKKHRTQTAEGTRVAVTVGPQESPTEVVFENVTPA